MTKFSQMNQRFDFRIRTGTLNDLLQSSTVFKSDDVSSASKQLKIPEISIYKLIFKNFFIFLLMQVNKVYQVEADSGDVYSLLLSQTPDLKSSKSYRLQSNIHMNTCVQHVCDTFLVIIMHTASYEHGTWLRIML